MEMSLRCSLEMQQWVDDPGIKSEYDAGQPDDCADFDGDEYCIYDYLVIIKLQNDLLEINNAREARILT
ncbi:MAG: hypothetical protein PHC61_14690 [Chitinivibrionales bacterium]|nr:hypothetical protein [Chitinivibrionales bacterium]